MTFDERLTDLDITLPSLPNPSGNYVHVKEDCGVLYVAGKGVEREGKVGTDFSVDEGYQIARDTGLLLLSAIHDHYGTLNIVEHIIRVYGMVNCHADFRNHPEVINGCSDLLCEVFGEHGRHVRMAVGANSLPYQTPVEIELSLRIKDV